MRLTICDLVNNRRHLRDSLMHFWPQTVCLRTKHAVQMPPSPLQKQTQPRQSVLVANRFQHPVQALALR